MNHPTPDQIRVSLAALRADAADWEAAAEQLRAAARRADAAAVPRAAFSFAGGPVADAYELLRAGTVTLLTGGADNFVDTARALRAAARTYEADEQRNVRRLSGIY